MTTPMCIAGAGGETISPPPPPPVASVVGHTQHGPVTVTRMSNAPPPAAPPVVAVFSPLAESAGDFGPIGLRIRRRDADYAGSHCTGRHFGYQSATQEGGGSDLIEEGGFSNPGVSPTEGAWGELCRLTRSVASRVATNGRGAVKWGKRNPLVVVLSVAALALVSALWVICQGAGRAPFVLPPPPGPENADAHYKWWGSIGKASTTVSTDHTLFVVAELEKHRSSGSMCMHARQLGSQINVALVGDTVLIDFDVEPTIRAVRRPVNHTAAPCPHPTTYVGQYYDQVVIHSGPLVTQGMITPPDTVLKGAYGYCAQYMHMLSMGLGNLECGPP